MPDVIHFDRKVYFRLFKRITSLFENQTATVPRVAALAGAGLSYNA